MATVKENLIAARALLDSEDAYLKAYRETGSAIAWAFDEVCSYRNEDVSSMFLAIGPFWVARSGHPGVLYAIDRAIEASE